MATRTPMIRRPNPPDDTTTTTDPDISRMAVIVAKKFGLTDAEARRLSPNGGLNTLAAEARSIVAKRSTGPDVVHEGPEAETSGTTIGNDGSEFVSELMSEYVRSGGPSTQRALRSITRNTPETAQERRDRIAARLDGTYRSTTEED